MTARRSGWIAGGRLRRFARRLRRDSAGTSVLEFALVLPFLVMLGLYGIELAYMATVKMRTSQIALSIADNASRLGQTDNSAVSPTVDETNIDAVMFGAMQEGKSLDFEQHGRIILSSLEIDEDDRQFIHWQRCSGDLPGESKYGAATTDGAGTSVPTTGLGKTGAKVMAREDEAVMFAEVSYQYQPLFGDLFVKDVTFRQEGAFVIRDDRNLIGGGGDGLTGTPTSTCDD